MQRSGVVVVESRRGAARECFKQNIGSDFRRAGIACLKKELNTKSGNNSLRVRAQESRQRSQPGPANMRHNQAAVIKLGMMHLRPSAVHHARGWHIPVGGE